MTQDNPSSWLAAHLYYNEPWERLLIESVLPFAEIIKQTGIAESWFFIRYWDRGPHIRLRFKATPTVIEQMLRSNTEEHFLNYFQSVPSFRTDPPYPAGIPESYKWLPNNSVCFEAYFPEYQRYGGEAGVGIAEEQFALSSKIILKYIESTGQQWSYDDSLGTAIKLHLSFLKSAGLNYKAVISFLKFYFENWLPHAIVLEPGERDATVIQKKKIETLQQFSDAYDLQKESLISFHKTLWKGLQQEEDTFVDVLLVEWIRENKLILNNLQQAEKENHLEARHEDFAYQKTKDHPFYQPLWDHYADYMHMTNNRLGVQNKDEGYLGYLMLSAMEELETSDDEEGRGGYVGKGSFISLE
ncbi:MAG: thiopeptide-type bacteriocin biosynthesis protein [Saprospiraceae bacterium]